MTKYRTRLILIALLGSLATTGLSSPTYADTGTVSVVFTKGGFIVGVGGGNGVLTLHGKHYRFTVSGMSLGFTVGASTTKLVGRALNLRSPRDLAGSYAAVGAGGAFAAGAGGVRVAEHQRCHSATQWPEGGRGSFGGRGRRHHHDAMTWEATGPRRRPVPGLRECVGGDSPFEPDVTP